MFNVLVPTFDKVDLLYPKRSLAFGELRRRPHGSASHWLAAWPSWRIFVSKALHSWEEGRLLCGNEFWQTRGQEILTAGLLSLSCVRGFWHHKNVKNLCISVQITWGSRNYYGRYVPEIWCVCDPTDMLYGPEGWQLSNWRTKPVCWRVNSTPRHKHTRFTNVKALKHELPQYFTWFQKYS